MPDQITSDAKHLGRKCVHHHVEDDHKHGTKKLGRSICASKSCLVITKGKQGFVTSRPNPIRRLETTPIASHNFLNEVPQVILALIESYLPPSSIVSLTLTSTKLHKRWTSTRWKKTFRLHYGIASTSTTRTRDKFSSVIPSSSSSSASSPSTFPNACNSYKILYRGRYGSWENSFVCDGDDVDGISYVHRVDRDDDNAANTKFNHNSLLPSLKHYYKSLWHKIELSMLGLELPTSSDDTHINYSIRNQAFDDIIHHHQSPSRQRRHNFTAFATVTKVIKMLFAPLIEYAIIMLSSQSDFVGWQNRRNCGNDSQRGENRFFEFQATLQNGEKVNNNCTLKSLPYQLAGKSQQNGMIDSMSAWKLACLLKERGMNCARCRLCNKIDVVGNNKSEATTWITPCQCPEPVHKKCLEEMLGLTQSLYSVEKISLALTRLLRNKKEVDGNDDNATLMRAEDVAPKLWLSYDSPIDDNQDRINGGIARNPAHVDEFNKFSSSSAKCPKCGLQYSRALRLPRNIQEIIFSSLSDRLAILRAMSTFAHFLLCIGLIAAIEAKCIDNDSCTNNVDISPLKGITLKWPAFTWKGIALAWWQLQQCCMLHIFFSARFVAIVDRLWLQSRSFVFYVKLYVYFVCTSLLLACFIPVVSRWIGRNILSVIMSEHTMEYLSPLWDAILLCNLCQYAVSSTTVIIIFWRTHYRIYTVEDSKASTFHALHQDGATGTNHVDFDHPIYHGRWQR